MESLSIEQLSKVLEAPASPSILFEKLSQYESEASILLTSPFGPDPQLLSAFYSSYLIAHLLVDEINEGRMLTLRLPAALAGTDPTLQNSLTLFQAVWQGDHGQVYRILRELPWPSVLQGLVRRFELHFQDRTFQDVSKTYDAIRPATAATYLGIDMNSGVGTNDDTGNASSAVVGALTTKGWDADAGLLYPKAVASPLNEEGSPAKGLSGVLGLLANRRN